jgi:predicted transglutaminase-like cysteine proteinase
LTGLKAHLEQSKLGDLLIRKGVISEKDLSHALQIQKDTHKPLGQIFIESAAISRTQLFGILFKQTALRTTATGLLFFMTATSFSSKTASAETITDVPAKIQLANVSSEFARVSAYPALFGTAEKKSHDLKAFTKWTSMFNRFDKELSNTKSVKVMQDWQRDLQQFKGGTISEMARDVNDLVNKTRYIVDKKNWGQNDYWATPVEFLTRGGDCEDFAIAKYTALRALGVPEERLRIAIVQDTQKNIPHAILVVYTEKGAVILDNQNKNMVNAEQGTRYKPIFSINRQAWWLHKADSKTVLASAE